MASIIFRRLKAFTLAEAVVASFIFLIALGIIANIVISLTNASFQLGEFHGGFENFRLGLEKLFREVKYGSDFNYDNITFSFTDRNCLPVSIKLVNKVLEMTKNSQQVTNIFDPKFIEINDWKVIIDPLTNPNSPFYFEAAPKFITFIFDVNFKSKVGKINMIIQQSIAPVNSVLPTSPCQQ